MKTLGKILLFSLLAFMFIMLTGYTVYIAITSGLELDESKLVNYEQTITLYDGDGNKILEDLIRNIRNECGSDFIIDVRLGNHDMDALIASAKTAEKAGADVLHISRGAWNDGDASLSKHEKKAELLHSPAPTAPMPGGFKYSYTVFMASEVKPHVNIPVICVGDIRRPEEAEDVLEKGYADLAALGRAQLADPEWCNKAAAGKEPDYCLNCKACRWMQDGTGKTCAARILAARKNG